MRFIPLEPAGVWQLDLELHADERGFFARSWAAEELEAHGLDSRLAQCSVSYNHRRATLRGLHFQAEPHAEAKLVRCTAGSIYDVAVDLRPGSPTFAHWVGVELTAENRSSLFIPAGFAHGFQSLADDSEVLYQISVPYSPDHARGVRWDDPTIGVAWPLADPILSERDRDLPFLEPAAGAERRG
jgi:dTDP-4-dehydrorhamnose 3,5-epimerase